MKKKFIIALLITIFILAIIRYYNSHKTVECWWTTLYPCFSYENIEEHNDISNSTAVVSSSNEKYLYIIEEEEPIEFKISFIEWIKSLFQ